MRVNGVECHPADKDAGRVKKRGETRRTGDSCRRSFWKESGPIFHLSREKSLFVFVARQPGFRFNLCNSALSQFEPEFENLFARHLSHMSWLSVFQMFPYHKTAGIGSETPFGLMRERHGRMLNVLGIKFGKDFTQSMDARFQLITAPPRRNVKSHFKILRLEQTFAALCVLRAFALNRLAGTQSFRRVCRWFLRVCIGRLCR